MNVLVQVFGTGQGQFDAGIPGTLSFNSTRIPITVEGVPFGAGSYDYRVTFSNSAGSEVVNGTVALDPISCGPVTVTVTGHNSFNNGAGTWPIVFTPNNPCPRGAAAPALNVIAPPGCLPYPQPLTTQCTTASTSLANGFGYTVLASNPPGFVVDGVNFVSGDGVPALSQPSGPSYTSKVSLQEIARESPTGTTYVIRVRSQDAFGPPNINGCSPLGGSGSVFSFRCSVPDDLTNSQVPVVVTMVPGPARPRGRTAAWAGPAHPTLAPSSTDRRRRTGQSPSTAAPSTSPSSRDPIPRPQPLFRPDLMSPGSGGQDVRRTGCHATPGQRRGPNPGH